jgi:hypothetical protein
MTLRITLLIVCLGLLVAGAELVHQSADMPQWIDETQAENVQSWPVPDITSGPAYRAYNKHWAAAMDALRTNKWPTYDAGAAMMALGASLAIGLYLLGIRNGADVAALTTPRRGWMVYLLAMAAWFGYWGSALAAVYQGFDRYEFPYWADSLLIPMVKFAIAAVIGWLVLSVVAWIVLRHPHLPASLWIWRKDFPMHTGLYTVGAATFILFALEVLRETYFFGHWAAIPAMLLWIYTALAFRAAGIARAASSPN